MEPPRPKSKPNRKRGAKGKAVTEGNHGFPSVHAAGRPELKASAAAIALRLLARREHTRRELAQKLAPHVEDPVELEALLEDFTARGWISESRVVEQIVNSKRARFGSSRIRQVMIERGVSDELIAPALQSLKDSELAAARVVWSRKFRAPATSREERAKQVRFLQSRGFGMEIAMRVVRGTEDA